ncbi:MAG TPA: hypothetical protein VFA41_08310 [Ktedonobacteraceae bacterium]|nr:hypothetical protein [Ktedonobacteraceae bacterium]
MSMLKVTRRGSFVRSAGMLLVTVLFVLLMAACGTNTTTGGGQPSNTPTTAPTHPQNCGSLHKNQLALVQKDKAVAPQDENCFWQAYQQCSPATLTFTQTSIDTGVIHTFTVKNVNGKCTITDSYQHFIAPNPPGKAVDYTCGSMTKESDGLHIASCGQMDTIVIPNA